MTGRARLLPAVLLSLLGLTTAVEAQAPASSPGAGRPAPATLAGDGGTLPSSAPLSSPAPTAASTAESAPVALAPRVAEEAFGVSRALRAAVLRRGEPVSPSLLAAAGTGSDHPRWTPMLGTVRQGLPGEPVYTGSVLPPEGPGIWRLEAGGETEEASAAEHASDGLSFITTIPFDRKRDGYLNGYHIGSYPTEGSEAAGVYAPPEGFIEVTPENRELPLSEHFRLGQFLTKDQFDVWPKYVALNLRLIDKLELVLHELNLMGVRAMEIHVMSGYRTPQYNGPGGDGRATLSRHMYGDAADIWIDGDRDGYIDDLNGDGIHDIRDAAILLRAVERVEQRYPELTGGAGLYESSDDHGPYVHVDVRGSRARW